MDGALLMLDILPTFIMPSFSNICPITASVTLNNIRSIFFNIYLFQKDV